MKEHKVNNEGNTSEKAKRPHLDKKKLKASFTSKAFKAGGYSTLVSAIVIAIAIAVVFMADKIPSKYTKLDISSSKIFSISQQTKEIVSSLDQQVDIYYICETGKEDSLVQELVDRYADMSSSLKVVKKDPVVYPTFTSQYTTDTLANNSLIVVCEDRSTVVNYSDIMVSDYSNYYTTGSADTSFDGEAQLTSAIDYVTSKDLPKLYTLSGHGEKGLTSTFSNAVSKQNIDVEDLSLVSKDAVPEDAECLAIIGPENDISEDEKDVILKYLEGGGNLLVISDYSETEMPNLESLMESYGVKKVNGLVLEGDANYCYRAANYLLPEIGSHEITSPLISGRRYVMMPSAHGIEQMDNVRSSVSISQLLTTTSSAYSKTNINNASTYEKEDGDIDGPFALGVAITETVGDTKTNIVWYSTTYMMDDDVNEAVAGANQDLFLNTLGWLCDKEDSISIHSKSLSSDSLVMTSAQTSRLKTIFIGLIPLAFIGVGAYVCIRRKHR